MPGETPIINQLRLGEIVYDLQDKRVDDLTIIANPTLVGTEATLTSIQIGNTKYKVDSASDIYAQINTTEFGTLVIPTYSGNILGDNVEVGGASSGTVFIKFDEPPTSDLDYDASLAYAQGSTVQGITSYSNKTKVYYWSDFAFGKISYLNEDYPVSISTIGYNGAQELTLTQDADITLTTWYSSGGGGNN